MKARIFKIDDDLWQALDAEAKRVGVSRSEIMRRIIIKNLLKKYENKKD
jgi:metal-responsive CopG/Arc/MetJ family transcriptional regulator